MKIFFEDGKLDKHQIHNCAVINADCGVTNNIYMLKLLRKRETEYGEEIIVYTNSIIAFDNKYAWNTKLKVPEIYIKAGEEFVRIDNLTKRKLRQNNNLAKLYLAREFEGGKCNGCI